jgi:O-antigen ligase
MPNQPTTPFQNSTGVAFDSDQKPGNTRPLASRRKKAKLESTFRLLFGATLITSIFQLYIINVADTYPPTDLLLAIALLGVVLLTKRYSLNATTIVLLLFLLAQAVSLAWAVDYFRGLRRIVYEELPFFALYWAAESLAKANEGGLIRIIKIYAAVSTLQSALTILFRLSPGAESWFLHSDIALLVINPNALSDGFRFLRMFGISNLNVISFDKAGGLTIYGNVVSLWGFASCCFAIICSKHGRSIYWYPIAFVHLGSILACGSKAGVVLLVIVPAVMMALYFFRAPRRIRMAMVLAALVGLAGIGAVVTTFLASPDHVEVVQDTVETISVRSNMWTFAGQAFSEHPFLGLGFNGWETEYPKFATLAGIEGPERYLPPHNGFIYTWSESGFVAVVLEILAASLLLWRAYLARKAPHGKLVSACAFGCYFWLVAQSMGENWNIFGEPHTQAPIALLLGYASALASSRLSTTKLYRI